MSDISFVLLYVADVAASEAFYAKALGRGAIEASPTFAMIPAAPGLMLGLWRRDGVVPTAGSAGGGELAIALGGNAEVDAACADWRAKGIEIIQAPTNMDFGYTFLAKDPDGHRLRVFAPAG